MKGCSAVFGIVAGLFAVASPVFNSGWCIAAEGADHPPEARLFDDLTEWEYQSGGTKHLSCEDVCKEEPKLFRVFKMFAQFPAPDGDDKISVLARQVEQTLRKDGWTECKPMYNGDGTDDDTYSKHQKLLKVFQAYSNGVGGRLSITIAEKEVKPRPVPSNAPVSITSEWKTYGNSSLGFEIRYPPNWGVESVEAGYGVIKSVGNCNENNCLMMRLGTDEEFAGDGLDIVISPEEIYSGEPCKPGPYCCGRTRISPSGQKYSSCTATTGPRKLPSTDYAIGSYATFADRQEDSGSETCRRTLDLWTTVGDYRYAFTPNRSEPLTKSFEMRDVYRKILSTVKVTPVRVGEGDDQPRQPVR
jgi:hypothetical protein